MKKGVIYKYGDRLHGEIRVVESLKKVLVLLGLRTTSVTLLSAAFLMLALIYGPALNEELNYALGNRQFSEDLYLQKARAGEIQQVQAEAKSYGVESHFSIVVPKIGASANIIANVDLNNEESYKKALEKGVAHAAGTYFPGQGREIYLFSHSTDSALNVTRYNAVFYLLRKLEAEDSIYVYFADKKYIYKVTQSHIVEATDVSWLRPRNKETLILQTCYPPGTTWKRLIVTAEPMN